MFFTSLIYTLKVTSMHPYKSYNVKHCKMFSVHMHNTIREDFLIQEKSFFIFQLVVNKQLKKSIILKIIKMFLYLGNGKFISDRYKHYVLNII